MLVSLYHFFSIAVNMKILPYCLVPPLETLNVIARAFPSNYRNYGPRSQNREFLMKIKLNFPCSCCEMYVYS